MSAPIDPLLEDALRRYRTALGEAKAEVDRLHTVDAARAVLVFAAFCPLVRVLDVARANENPTATAAELDELTTRVRTLTAESLPAEPPGRTSLRSALVGVTAVVAHAETDALASRRTN